MMPKLCIAVKPTAMASAMSSSWIIDRPIDGAGAAVTSGSEIMSMVVFLFQEAGQCRAACALSSIGDGDARHQVEPVECARPDVQLGRHAREDQPVRIFDVLIDEEVELTGRDEGWWKAFKKVRTGRGGIWRDVVASRLLAEQRGPAEPIVVPGPDMFAGVAIALGGASAVVDH